MGSNEPLKETLFSPLHLGALSLNHRVVLSPCARMRALWEAEGVYVPGKINTEYYFQRASAGGLLVTEATSIARDACGYPGAPGIFTLSQIEGWSKVTDAVHSQGGYIYCQLWHVGRGTVSSLIEGQQPCSSSDIPILGRAVNGEEYSSNAPRPMTVSEIQETTAEYAEAAKRARRAGFDGVEIHAANGYLLEQFLSDNVNTRNDQYGGSIENRCRFILEVIEAVAVSVGADRVGIRLSPYNTFQDIDDSNRNKHWAFLCQSIASLSPQSRPAYVHMIEPRIYEDLDQVGSLSKYAKLDDGSDSQMAKTLQQRSLNVFRACLKEGGVYLIASGGFNRESAVDKVSSDEADAISFGRSFIANPDLPRRLLERLTLNAYDRSTFYGADPPSTGYIDYPFYEA